MGYVDEPVSEALRKALERIGEAVGDRGNFVCDRFRQASDYLGFTFIGEDRDVRAVFFARFDEISARDEQCQLILEVGKRYASSRLSSLAVIGV